MGRSVNISTTIPPPVSMAERLKIPPARQKELTAVLEETRAQLDAELGGSSASDPKNTKPDLQYSSFDTNYIESLCAGDRRTEEHFVAYFTASLQLKLRSRLHSPQAVEDVRQETFARVLKALSKGGALRQPERLGAFVNTVCNNVLFEHYRSSARNPTESQSLEDEGVSELTPDHANALSFVAEKQVKDKIRKILFDLPVRDRTLLKEIYLDERDREEVCREFGVDREYLRVLLHRAKVEFKKAYIKNLSYLPKEVNAKSGRGQKIASTTS